MENETLGEEITTEDSVVPIYLVPLTEDDIVEREAWAAEQEARNAEEAAKEAAKKSAQAKLAKLGLTAEEIAAIVSI